MNNVTDVKEPSVHLLKTPEEILNVKSSEVTKKFLLNNFAILGDNSFAHLPPTTKVILDEKIIKDKTISVSNAKNSKDIVGIETTVGRILLYSYLFDIPYSIKRYDSKDTKKVKEVDEGNLLHLVPFINAPYTKKIAKVLDTIIADLLLDGKINNVVVDEYINRCQWFGYTASIFASGSLDDKTINPSKKVKDFRDKKLAESAEIITNKDLRAFSKVEQEIIDYTCKELVENRATGKFIYDSGFNGSINNNLKVTSLLRGIAPKSNDLSGFEILESCLNEGVSKKDLASHADIAVIAASGRAKDTRLAGYKTKLFNAAFGAMKADDNEASNCKTKLTKNILLTEANFSNYRYRNIQDDKGAITTLTADNYKKYVGKTLNMRSPSLCKNRVVCATCMGEMTYKLKIHHIGLHISRITTNLMNLSMKSFHNLSVENKSVNYIDYMKSKQ